jgi:hypothetical protein
MAVTGLIRNTGIGTGGTAAARGWGGVSFSSANAAAAVIANQDLSFTMTANSGYKMTLSSIAEFDYRRSGTGPTNGSIQYQVGTGGYFEITNITYSSSASSGASLGPIDLSGINALKNIPGGTVVNFRIVNYGGGSSGTWYLYDVSNSTSYDFAISGTIAPSVVLTPLQTWRLQNFGNFNNTGIAADSYVNSADGLANLLKYAMGLPPFSVVTNPVTGDISTGYLRMTCPRSTNATDITISAQISSDLKTWTTNGIVVDVNSSTQFRAHDASPVSVGTNRFMRLNFSE